ncbi:TPA: transcription termination/antitermination factor NusG [bacterium]|nr:transcription termination/antitermination factor NusG [bacterium]
MAKSWYVLHTYSGHENKVKVNLRQRINSFRKKDKDDADIIIEDDIKVPTQQITEIKDGKKRTLTKTSFPGYVLINIDLDDELRYVIKNTPGVMGFVGSGSDPIPLEEEEVESILTGGDKRAQEEAKHAYDFSTGDKVKVIDGPFTGFSGVIDELNEEKSKLKLMISIFGRSTPVELEFHQVEKSRES